MNIAAHIERLLYEERCVIVPELGAFVVSYVSSTFDAKRSMMLPPRGEIVFNQRLTHNDGLLASRVAEAEGKSFAEAQREVDLFVQSTKQQLASGCVVMLSGLGSMRRVEGDIVFSCSASSNFLPSSYGFAPISVDPVTPSLSLSLPSMDKVKRFAVTAAAVAALLFATPSLQDGQVAPEFTQASLAESLIVPEAVPVAEEEAEAETVKTAKYHIIVASFVSRREANDYIDLQRSRGIDNLECLEGKGRVRVSVASFDDEQQARTRNKACRKIQGFEKAWVLRTE